MGSALIVTLFLRLGGGQLRRIRRTLTAVENRWVSMSILTSATCTMSAQARAGHSDTLVQRALFSAWSQGSACLRKRWSAKAEKKRHMDVNKRGQRWNKDTIAFCWRLFLVQSSYINWIMTHVQVNKSYRFG